MSFRLRELSPGMCARPSRTSQREPPRRPRIGSHVREYSRVELRPGCWRVITNYSRAGLDPCTLITIHYDDHPERLPLRQKIFRSEAATVLRAIELAEATDTWMFKQECGSLVLRDGSRLVVSAVRYRGNYGVSFRLIGADGTARGKPKSLHGREFEAFASAIRDLLK
jgi:hypothetical protein